MSAPKAVGAALAALLLAGAVFVVNLVWFHPFSLDLFFEKVFIEEALDKPEMLTELGIAEQFGYRRHNAHLDDISIAQTERDAARVRARLAELKAYDTASQSPSQKLSTRVLTWYLEGRAEGEPFRFHDYPVEQLWGVQNQTPDFLINSHAVTDRLRRDWPTGDDEEDVVGIVAAFHVAHEVIALERLD